MRKKTDHLLTVTDESYQICHAVVWYEWNIRDYDELIFKGLPTTFFSKEWKVILLGLDHERKIFKQALKTATDSFLDAMKSNVDDPYTFFDMEGQLEMTKEELISKAEDLKRRLYRATEQI